MRSQDFIGAAAHQLRTPLARLTTELEVALRAPRDGDADQATLARLKSTVDQLSRLVQQLLALAQSDASRGLLETLSDIDLKDIALERGVDWVPRAAEAGIDLGFEVQPARVRGHAQLLGEALVNLIDNALRHGARRVTVRTARRGDRCELDVDDDGSGIAPGDRERMFQRFVRGAGEPAGGSGLGLPIVRQVVELHGGQVTLLDGAQGGLCARISLPAAGAATGTA